MAIKGFICRVRSAAILSSAIKGKQSRFNFIKYPTGTTKGGFKRLVKSGRYGRRDGRVRSSENGH